MSKVNCFPPLTINLFSIRSKAVLASFIEYLFFNGSVYPNFVALYDFPINFHIFSKAVIDSIFIGVFRSISIGISYPFLNQLIHEHRLQYGELLLINVPKHGFPPVVHL